MKQNDLHEDSRVYRIKLDAEIDKNAIQTDMLGTRRHVVQGSERSS